MRRLFEVGNHEERSKTGQRHHFKRSMQLKGQLISLSKKKARERDTKYALLTRNGKIYSVYAPSSEGGLLANHLGKYVRLYGVVDSVEQAIYIDFLDSEEEFFRCNLFELSRQIIPLAA